MSFGLDLPKPISVNAIWRNNRGRTHISERYKTWKRVADNMVMQRKRAGSNYGPLNSVDGPFTAIITVDRKKRRKGSDIDNLAKCVLDYLERIELIENDSLCESVLIRWGDAPEGCRVWISPATQMEAA